MTARPHRKFPQKKRTSTVEPCEAPSKSAAAKPRAASTNRAALVKRMWRAAELQVCEIENRILQGTPEPDDRERDARLLAVVAKTLRELSALEDKKPQKQTVAPADDDAVPRDLDELRRSLARKLEALVAGGTAVLPDDP